MFADSHKTKCRISGIHKILSWFAPPRGLHGIGILSSSLQLLCRHRFSRIWRQTG